MTTPAADASAGSLRRLGHDTATYGLGVVLSRAVSFILLPVYTRYLSPSDYGLLQLLQMVVDILAILVSAGTTAGVFRFYFKAQTEDERRRVVVTAFLMLAGLNLAGALVLMPLAPLIWKYGLSHAGSPALVRIAASNFVLDSCVTVPMLLMQVRRRAGLYTATTLGKLILGLCLNILFIVGLRKGVGGILVANLITNVLIGAFLVTWMLRQTGLVPSRAAASDLRRFGLPYQLATAGTFVLNFGDRAFLQAFHGLAAVGIYGLAYQCGFMLINLTSAPFFRAWGPQRLQLASSSPREVRDESYNQAFRYLNLLVVTVAVGMSLFAWPAVAILSDPQYRSAASLVPVITAAFLVQVWTDVVSLGIEVSERTKYATYATWIGAAAILALYAALIPALAGMGAALATLLGFIVRFACFYRFSQKLWPVAWRWEQPVRLAGIGAILVAVCSARTPTGIVSQAAIATACFLVYAAAAWVVILSPRERRQIASLLKTPRRAPSGVASA